MRSKFNSRAMAAGLFLAAMATQGHAASVSFAGTFTSDDNIAVLSFTTLATGSVTIETYSYAGGTDPTGRAVSAGGFDPVFGLFSSTGALLAVGDDGATRIDVTNGAAFDALVTTTLAAGTYYVALGEYDNYPNGPTLADAFSRSGAGNFTAAFGCSAGKFCDVNGFSRTGNYDLAITGATVAAVPEPSTFALMASALAGLGGWVRSRSRKNATR